MKILVLLTILCSLSTSGFGQICESVDLYLMSTDEGVIASSVQLEISGSLAELTTDSTLVGNGWRVTVTQDSLLFWKDCAIELNDARVLRFELFQLNPGELQGSLKQLKKDGRIIITGCYESDQEE